VLKIALLWDSRVTHFRQKVVKQIRQKNPLINAASHGLRHTQMAYFWQNVKPF